MTNGILLFGDTYGLPQLLRHVPTQLISGLVMAEIRLEQREELEKLAEQYRLPLYIQPKKNSIRYPHFLDELKKQSADWILVHSYSMLLHPELLALPARGAINIHQALLPQYRGCNPIQWAIIRKENETGVTMHVMTEGIDEGPIIAQRKVPIHLQDTWVDVRERLTAETERMLAEMMPKIVAGDVRSMPQNSALAAYHRRRKPEDGKIDGNFSIISIYNLIRALVYPLPGAFYTADGDTVSLNRYLTLTEVARLKLQLRGDGDITSDHYVYKILDDADPLAITFEVYRKSYRAPIGKCRLCNLDYTTKIALINVAANPEDRPEIMAAMQQFANQELEIEVLEGRQP